MDTKALVSDLNKCINMCSTIHVSGQDKRTLLIVEEVLTIIVQRYIKDEQDRQAANQAMTNLMKSCNGEAKSEECKVKDINSKKKQKEEEVIPDNVV